MGKRKRIEAEGSGGQVPAALAVPAPSSASAAEPSSSRRAQRSAEIRLARTMAPPEAGAAALPPQLDVSAALATRAAQVRTLLQAMTNARNARTIRAWQTLPREQRRRAASHNLLRLPARLRAKGKRELDASRTTAQTRSETRKRKPDRTVKLATQRMRQLRERAGRQGARWLETHLWHAKRFHMTRSVDEKVSKKYRLDGPEPAEPSTGFILAETPHMKAHRASWRSAKDNCIVHDASYEACVLVTADDDQVLSRVLRRAGIEDASRHPDGSHECATVLLGKPGGRIIRSGVQAGHDAATTGERPFLSTARLLTPVRVLWLPDAGKRQVLLRCPPNGAASVRSAMSEAIAEERDMGEVKLRLQKELALQVAAPSVTIFVLPNAPAPDKAVQSGRRSDRKTLRARLDQAGFKMNKREAGKKGQSSEVVAAPASADSERSESLWRKDRLNRKEKVFRRLLDAQAARAREVKSSVEHEGFNAFELVGPDSGRLLGGTLRPVAAAYQQAQRDALKQVAQRPIEQVAAGMVLAINVHDPRLSFPGRLAPKASAEPADVRSRKRKRGQDVVASMQGSAELAQGAFWTRRSALPIFRKGDIDRRRAMQLVPGTRLEPTSMDDILPVVIIRHGGGYTLLVPRGWGLAFWLSLVSPGARVAGQAQVRHRQLENGALSFPHDYLGTAAFDAYWAQQAQVRKREWKKRPKGKRQEYKQLGIEFPFGGKEMWVQCLKNGVALAARNRKPHRLLKEVVIGDKTMPWLLPARTDAEAFGKVARQLLLDEGAPDAEAVLEALRPLLHMPGDRLTANDVSRLATAFVPVTITACRRANFDELSPLFLASQAQDLKWRATLQAIAADGQQDHKHELQALETGSVSNAIGAVTSGGYSLTQGRGHAVAAVSFLAFLETVLRDEEAQRALPQPHRLGRNPIRTTGLMISRDLGGPTLRAASASMINVAY